METLIADCNKTTEELNSVSERVQRLFEDLPRIETCAHSYIPQGRLFCEELQMRVSIAYCESCSEYKSKMEIKI